MPSVDQQQTIHAALGQAGIVGSHLLNGDVRQPFLFQPPLEVRDHVRLDVEGQHATGRSNRLCQIRLEVPRPCADVRHDVPRPQLQQAHDVVGLLPGVAFRTIEVLHVLRDVRKIVFRFFVSGDAERRDDQN